MQNLPWSRRQFLQFLGASAAASATITPGCTTPKKQADTKALGFEPLAPTYKDDLVLATGLTATVLASFGDQLKSDGSLFGYNNDYTAFVPMSEGEQNEGYLWVNHESIDPLFVSGRGRGEKNTRKHFENEVKMVGGSILHIKKDSSGWKLQKNSKHNARFDATTPMQFSNGETVAGSKVAIGTLANCAGGYTPWGTFLTCEENYDDFFGETEYRDDGSKVWRPSAQYMQWEKFDKRPPEHYGWVVEIDPKTKKAKKHTSIGRYAHECATVTQAKDGRIVVYSGDDANDECIYKMISNSKDSLNKGTLYVADTKKGEWLPLDVDQDPQLKAKFKTQLELLIRTREAAKMVGGTPQNRPEDIEINPTNGDVLVALTNNKPKGDYTGTILKIAEKNSDAAALTFKSESLLTGGEDAGFACPDNLVFDKAGNLWFTTDISGGSIGKAPYEPYGNNALFYVPMSGVNAGFAFKVASAPKGAELTGPTFSPDGRTLFLSVQHPGEGTQDLKNPVSRWPLFGDQLPKPSVVTLEGPLMDKLTQG
jgi:secreted PhoX family phosphatase